MASQPPRRPFNPIFHSYLFLGLESAILFIEEAKLTNEVKVYLQSIGVDWRDYNDIWTFLRRKEWGEGNVSRTWFSSVHLNLTRRLAGHHLAADVVCHLLDDDQFPVHGLAVVR